MSRTRVVAELGRPETPAETAARKAESSRVYRSSQTFRNLIAGMIATLAMVAIIVLVVPRGDLAEPKPIDVQSIADSVTSTTGHTALVAPVPELWRVNRAESVGAQVGWTVVYAPTEQSDDTGFVTLLQRFGATEESVAQTVPGARANGTEDIDGIVWTTYAVSGGSADRNVTVALGVQAGDDYVLLYGASSAEVTMRFASALAEQIRTLEKTA